MSTSPNRRLPYPVAPITTVAGWLFISTSLVAVVVSPPQALAAADRAIMLAGEASVPDLELADLRGGFVTEDGLEISFGFRIDLGLDDRLGLSMEFDPLPQLFEGDGPGRGARKPGRRKPGRKKPEAQVAGPGPMLPGTVKLTLKDLGAGAAGEETPIAEFGLGLDGLVEVLSGTPDVTETANGKRYDFGGALVADVVETAEGVSVETVGGGVPVRVVRTAGGIGLEVGDEAGTLIVSRITPSLIDNRVTNRRYGAQVDQQMTFDINLLNFNELSARRKVFQSGRRMQRLVDRQLIRMMATPR